MRRWAQAQRAQLPILGQLDNATGESRSKLIAQVDSAFEMNFYRYWSVAARDRFLISYRCSRCASISGVVDRGIGITGGRFHSVRVESRSGSGSPAERRFRVKLGRISGDDVTRGSASSPGAGRDMPNRA